MIDHVAMQRNTASRTAYGAATNRHATEVRVVHIITCRRAEVYPAGATVMALILDTSHGHGPDHGNLKIS